MRILALSLALAALAAPAFAAPVVLKADTTDTDGRITLSDLFDGAGAAGATMIGTRNGPTVVLDATLVQSAARRAGLEWDNPQGLRRIVVRGGVDLGSTAQTPISGAAAVAVAARGNVQVLTWARSLAVGEVVQPQDLIWAKAAAAPAGAPQDVDAVVGMSARRPLREGAAVAGSDVAAAMVIKTGDLITVTYANDGVTLTLQGKAMANAAVGDLLPVQNTTSKKLIQAVVTGPGAAVTGPDAQSQRAPPRTFASR